MKKITVISCAAAMLLALACSLQSNAQLVKSTYFNADWQFNAPVGNDYADVASGWGMSVEGGFYVMPRLAIGMYFSYHTNNKLIGEQVLDLSTSSRLYTDQQHSVFQLPFGALVRYRFNHDKQWEPYAALKLGALYAQMDSYTQVVKFTDSSWGFNMQPEVGLTFFPYPRKRFGIHLALYYNYSTNRNNNLTYSIEGYNNIGFHLGLAF